jgi:hypothetical protein
VLLTGVLEQVGRVPLLDQRAAVQHADGVRDLADHREVMGDEQVDRAVLALDAGQQLDHLRLHGDVEGGDRLVQDQQLGAGDDPARDRDPLALPAGELRGAALEVPRGQCHRIERLAGPRAGLLAAGGDPESLERLGEDPPDVLARIERAVGVLEDVLDEPGGLAAQGAGPAGERALPDAHLPAVGPVDAREQAGDGGLPRPRAAHQAVGASARDGEADVPGGVDVDVAAASVAEPIGPGQALDPHVGLEGAGGIGPSGSAGAGHGVHQAPGVLRARVDDDAGGGALLDEAAAAEHEDPVAAVRGDGEVVGDQHCRDPRRVHDLVEEVEHALLHLDVESAGRLVGDDNAGAPDQRDRDQHALALTARELVRMGVVHAPGVLEPHLLQQRDRPLLAVGLLDLRFGEADPLGDLPADAHHGVQGDVGVLRDVGDAAPAQPVPGLLVDPVGALLGGHAVGDDPAGVGAGVRREDPEQRLDEGRLPRPGLADDREAFAGAEGEADVLHGAHGLGPAAAGGRKVVDAQRVDLEDWGVGHGHRALSTNLLRRLAESTTSAMTTPGMSASQGAVDR